MSRKPCRKGRTVFAELSRLLDGNPYFAGKSVSLADLLVAPQMDFLALTPEWKALSADDAESRRLARSHERASQHEGNHLGPYRAACSGVSKRREQDD